MQISGVAALVSGGASGLGEVTTRALAMTRPAARDLSAVGVRVCTIAPGLVDTPMLAGLPDEARAALAAGIPFPKRLAAPSDFAELAMAVVRHGHLNGEIIRMDGALRMAPR